MRIPLWVPFALFPMAVLAQESQTANPPSPPSAASDAMTAQTPKKPADPNALQTVFRIADESVLLSDIWELHVYLAPADKKYAPSSREDLATYFQQEVVKTPSSCSRSGCQAEYALAQKHRDAVAKALNELPKVIGDSVMPMFWTEIGLNDQQLPVRFAKMHEQTCVVIPYIGVDTVFNTLRSDAKQRARKIASGYVMPLLASVHASLGDANIPCIAIGVVYGSKNFADRSEVMNLKPEYLLASVPRSVVQKFKDGELTDDEVLKQADVFMMDREMVADVKKIKLYGAED